MTAPGEWSAAARVREWRHARYAILCDSIAPWSHGIVARAARFPSTFFLNLVGVAEDPRMDAAALAALADEALAGLPHRRVEFDRAADGEPLRAAFHALGWETERDVWMRYAGEVPPMPTGAEEVPWSVANALRRLWHVEDQPGDEDFGYLEEWEQANRLLDVRTWVLRERGDPVAFAGLERRGDSAEVGPVYVRADCRGHGLGASVIGAALAGAGPLAGDLWIAADDEGRPRHLYERLGFDPVCTTLEAMRSLP